MYSQASHPALVMGPSHHPGGKPCQGPSPARSLGPVLTQLLQPFPLLLSPLADALGFLSQPVRLGDRGIAVRWTIGLLGHRCQCTQPAHLPLCVCSLTTPFQSHRPLISLYSLATSGSKCCHFYKQKNPTHRFSLNLSHLKPYHAHYLL